MYKLNRSEYNTLILQEVSNYLKKHPDLRFIQALWALNIVDREDRFYEEPDVTYKKVVAQTGTKFVPSGENKDEENK